MLGTWSARACQGQDLFDAIVTGTGATELKTVADTHIARILPFPETTTVSERSPVRSPAEAVRGTKLTK